MGRAARFSQPLHCPSGSWKASPTSAPLCPLGSPEGCPANAGAPLTPAAPHTIHHRAERSRAPEEEGEAAALGCQVSGSDPSWRASFPLSGRPRGRNARGHQAAAGPAWGVGCGSRPGPGLPRPPAPPPGRRVLGGRTRPPRRAAPRIRAPRLPPGCPQAGARPAGRWCSPPRARARALPGSGSRLRRGRSGEAGVRLAAPVRGSGPRPAPASPASLRARARRPVPAAAAAATSRV